MIRTAWLRPALRSLFNILLPPACTLCLSPLHPPDPDNFCESCRKKILPRKQACCPRCKLPYPAETEHGHYCQACLLEKKPVFTGVTSAGHYDGLLRETIHRFKYRNNINLDRPLARLLANQLHYENIDFSLIIPVPLHRSRLRERTYNQSSLLARQIARMLDCPASNKLLQRTGATPAQQTLSARERQGNVRNSFTLTGKLQGEKILLIDDVMTTGATARECARTLLKGGAASVHIAVLARATLR